MNILNNLRFLLLLSLGMLLFSCSDEDLPSSQESPYGTTIESIEITNAGVLGDKVVQGVIDYDKSEIRFPVISKNSDFTKIHFKAVLPNGASLDQELYDFTMEGDNAESSRIITVTNETRVFQYKVTVVRNMPPKGADFSQIKVFNFSLAAGNIYPSFTSGNTRGSASDGENILVIDRTAGEGNVHLLKVSDLMAWKPGDEFSPQKLDAGNPPVVGGTLPYSTGAVVNGHVYIMNVSNVPNKDNPESGLKLYYYETPKSVPQLILHDKEVNDARFADATTFNIDEKGNGTIFCFQNGGTNNVIRINIVGYTNVVSVQKFAGRKSGSTPPSALPMAYASCGKVEGEQLFIYAGKDLTLTVADAGGNISFEDKENIFYRDAMDPRVFYFNGERYLTYVTTGARDNANTLCVYNITKGEGVVDALEKFIEGADTSPIFTLNLGGTNSWNGNSNYKVFKDENGKDSELYIYGARTGGGFAFLKLPVKPYVELED